MYEKYIKLINKNIDLDFKNFFKKITFTKYYVKGVKTPILKEISKDILKNDYELFLKEAKDNSYEEVLLQGLVISGCKDIDFILKNIDNYFNKIDNWALCDLVCSNLKRLKENDIKNLVDKYIKDTNYWKVRVGFVLLNDYLINKYNLSYIFNIIDSDSHQEYYVMMAKAWLISTCYIKFPKETKEYLTNCKIDDTTYNKAISKIIDSKRVEDNDKNILKNMKR